MQALSLTSRELHKYDTAQLCLHSNTPTLSALMKCHNEETVEDYLVLRLVALNEKLNVSRPQPEFTLRETAFHIYNKYRYLTLADINLVFTRAETGEMGIMYEAISMAKVLSWFSDYAEERMQQAEMLSDREHDLYKNDRHPTQQEHNKRLSNLAGMIGQPEKEGGSDGQ